MISSAQKKLAIFILIAIIFGPPILFFNFSLGYDLLISAIYGGQIPYMTMFLPFSLVVLIIFLTFCIIYFKAYRIDRANEKSERLYSEDDYKE